MAEKLCRVFMAKATRKDANQPAAMALAVGAGATPVGPIVKDGNGQPTRRFAKDLIRVGKYVKASDGISFEVTPATLSHFVKTFDAMKAAGVRVPVPVGHTSDAEANRGYVESMYVVGDSLYAAMEFIGEDALKLAARSEVSIYVPPEFVDGKGNAYTQPILHVALVTDPVIPGQGKFIPIAASAGKSPESVPVYRLAQESTSMEALTKIAQSLGIDPASLDEAGLATAIAEKIAAWKSEMDMSRTKAKEMACSITASQAKIDALEKGAGLPKGNPDALDAAAKFVTLSLDTLQKSGKLGATARKLAEELLLGTDDARPGLMLSREVASAAGLPKPIADSILKILEANDPVILGGKTGAQLVLNRGTPGDDTDSKAVTESVSRMTGIINGNAKTA